MIRITLSIFASLILFGTYGQIVPGEYKRNSSGSLIAYPESDTTMLIYIEVNRGAPTYNAGVIYSRVHRRDEVAILRSFDSQLNCKLKLDHTKNQITIETIDADCGFGYGVMADGTFKMINSQAPKFFTNMEGEKVYFKETKPEDF